MANEIREIDPSVPKIPQQYADRMQIDPRIIYLIIVPDGRPEDATPLQGFASSLCENSWMIRTIAELPSTVFDLSDRGRKTLVPRRMTGGRPILWHGQSPNAVLSSVYPNYVPWGPPRASPRRWMDRGLFLSPLSCGLLIVR